MNKQTGRRLEVSGDDTIEIELTFEERVDLAMCRADPPPRTFVYGLPATIQNEPGARFLGVLPHDIQHLYDLLTTLREERERARRMYVRRQEEIGALSRLIKDRVEGCYPDSLQGDKSLALTECWTVIEREKPVPRTKVRVVLKDEEMPA